jgi:hypothetical protein
VKKNSKPHPIGSAEQAAMLLHVRRQRVAALEMTMLAFRLGAGLPRQATTAPTGRRA